MEKYGFRVTVPSEAAYEVVICPGGLDRFGATYRRVFADARAIILADDRVAGLYHRRLLQALRDADIESSVETVPEGEASKSLTEYERLLDALASLGADRRSVIVNLGGGMISDLGGFVASSYMRGIRYANVPTSLIGQVDASVGGKVAVNAKVAKNLIGAFHHPGLVVSDPLLLHSSPARDFRSGIAEAIKVGVIACPDLFRRLEEDRDAIEAREPAALTGMIGQAAEVKMDLVSADPYEQDLRRPLNFGHTLGHPIETEFAYRGIRHGEAVAVGMVVATFIARRRSLSSRVAERILSLIRAYGLPGFDEPIAADRVLERLRYIRLIRGNRLHFVLPVDIGDVDITDAISPSDIERGLADYRAWSKSEVRHDQPAA